MAWSVARRWCKGSFPYPASGEKEARAGGSWVDGDWAGGDWVDGGTVGVGTAGSGAGAAWGWGAGAWGRCWGEGCGGLGAGAGGREGAATGALGAGGGWLPRGFWEEGRLRVRAGRERRQLLGRANESECCSCCYRFATGCWVQAESPWTLWCVRLCEHHATCDAAKHRWNAPFASHWSLPM